MEQKFNILLNNRFTSSTIVQESSSLELSNSYYVNIESKPVKEEIVNEYNIRNFLNNVSNKKIVDGFITSFTGNPVFNKIFYISNGTQFEPTKEYKEIYYNDKKLASAFNDYYYNIIQLGQTVNNNLYYNEYNNTEGLSYTYNDINYIDNYYNWSNAIMYPKYINYIPLDFNNYTRNNSQQTFQQKFSTEESYYIDVFIQRTVNLTPISKIQLCNKKAFKSISTGNIGFYEQDSEYFINDFLDTLPEYKRYFIVDNNLTTSINVDNITLKNIETKNNNVVVNNEFGTNILHGVLYESFPYELTGGTIAPYQEEHNIFTGSQIVQCFIDINNSFEELETYSSKISEVYFDYDTNTFNEGENYSFKIKLSEPAIGNEHIDLNWIFIGTTLTASDFEYGVPASHTKTLSFLEGEQEKTINLKTHQDVFKYPDRIFYMNLSNPFNCKVKDDDNYNHLFLVKDSTVWNKVSFETMNPTVINGYNYSQYKEFKYSGNTFEIAEFSQEVMNAGIYLLVNITLDNPSSHGIESITIEANHGTTYNDGAGEYDWTIAWWEYDNPAEVTLQGLASSGVTGYSGHKGTEYVFPLDSTFKTRSFQIGEQVKTLVLQFPANTDNPSGIEEIFDLKITNIQYADAGDILLARIYIQDHVYGLNDLQ